MIAKHDNSFHTIAQIKVMQIPWLKFGDVARFHLPLCTDLKWQDSDRIELQEKDI